jgi:hypothetical protein
LSCATEKGSDTLFDAINKRQDDVYRRLYDEFNSLSLVPLNEIKYKCIIGLVIKPIQVNEIYNGLSVMFQNDASVSTMKTRSKTLLNHIYLANL